MPVEPNEIETLLAKRIGLDPVSVGSQLIVRAARLRMKELGLADLATYTDRLRQSESELQELVEQVVVSESWFFRDERPFQWLRDHVRARWMNNPARPPLRILSLPCAGAKSRTRSRSPCSTWAFLPVGFISMPWISALTAWKGRGAAFIHPTHSGAVT